MHFRSPALAVVYLLAAAITAPAQLAPKPPPAPTPQAPPPPKLLKNEDVAKKLAELEAVAKTLDEQRYGHNSKIIRELREAGASAEKSFSLWLDCCKDVDFDQKGKNQTEFSEWKRRQTKDPNHERDAELQMQVQWLTIVLMDANAKTDQTRAEAVGEAMTFVDNLIDRAKKSNGRLGGAASQDVMGSVFARHYKLDASVDNGGDGAFVPSDIDGIYERMVLPFFRDTKQSVSLMGAWQKRIAQQTALAGAHDYVEAKQKFTAEKLPGLYWGQARELFVLGQEEPATQTMMSLIKANMGHKDVSRWIEELTALLKKEDLPPAVSPSVTESESEPDAPHAPQNEYGPGRFGPGGNRRPGGRAR